MSSRKTENDGGDETSKPDVLGPDDPWRLPKLRQSVDTVDIELLKAGLKERDSEPELPYSKARCIALVVTACGSSFTDTFSIQAVVIILPAIGRDLGIPDSRLQWIMSAYSLAFGCFLLFWGRIADVYGMKRTFVGGTAWLALMTAISPLVRNEVGFDIIRGLQGLGAAANVPAALGILGTTFKPGKAKTYAFAAYGAGAPLGSIFGNILAGVISAYSSWQWVFATMVILSATIATAGILIIPASPPTARKPSANNRVDWLGAFAITLGMFLLLFAFTEVNTVGWRTPWIYVVVTIAGLLIAGFILWQLYLEPRGDSLTSTAKLPPPLLRPSVLRNSNGNLATAMLIMALFSCSFNGFLVYATYFHQSFQGLDTLQTTLRFVPTGVAGILSSIAVAFLLNRVPTWMILCVGNACVALASMLYALPFDPDKTSYFAYGLPAMSLAVMGSDSTWPSIMLFTSESVEERDQSLGGALVNAVGQVGRAMGLAAATAVQVGVMAAKREVEFEEAGPLAVGDGPSLEGLRAGFWFNFGIGCVSVAVIAVAFRGSSILGKSTK